MDFSRQEYWSGLPFPSPEDLSDPGIKPRSLALQADSLPSEPTRSEVDCQGNSPIVFVDVDTSPNRTCQVAQWVKNLLAMQETQIQSLGGKIPWSKAWQPTPIFLPGESHRQRSLMDYSPLGCKESDTTEATEHGGISCNTHIYTQTLQYCA